MKTMFGHSLSPAQITNTPVGGKLLVEMNSLGGPADTIGRTCHDQFSAWKKAGQNPMGIPPVDLDDSFTFHCFIDVLGYFDVRVFSKTASPEFCEKYGIRPEHHLVDNTLYYLEY